MNLSTKLSHFKTFHNFSAICVHSWGALQCLPKSRAHFTGRLGVNCIVSHIVMQSLNMILQGFYKVHKPLYSLHHLQSSAQCLEVIMISYLYVLHKFDDCSFSTYSFGGEKTSYQIEIKQSLFAIFVMHVLLNNIFFKPFSFFFYYIIRCYN